LPMVPICLDHSTFAQTTYLHLYTALIDHFHAKASSNKQQSLI
jgi:hypothetical protein